MDRSLSAKMNKVLEMKALIKQMEDKLKPMIEEVKSAVLAEGTKDDKGNWVLENGKTKALVTTSIRVDDVAVTYLKNAGRGDLVKVKEYTTADLLRQIMGEEEITREGLATYSYSLKVTEK
jgi:uncharacterized protein (DUF4415 family)